MKKKKMKERRVIPTFKELLEDMKPMTFWEKVDHIWTYYKEYLIIAFLVVVLVAVTINGYINANKEFAVRGMMVNITITQEGYSYLTEDYLTKFEGEDTGKEVEMDYANFADLADPANGEDHYMSSQKLQARVSGGLLDYALLEQMSYEFYRNQAVFGDLSTVFSKEQLDALGDKVIYANDEDLGTVPIAIDISGTEFVQENISKEYKVYFIISGNSPNAQACQNVFSHINDWKAE